MARYGLIAALFLAGCSAIVAGGEGDPIRCVMPQAGEADPCEALGPDWRCQGDFCQQIGCGAESCNDMDDDCDGSVDEELDDDGDGFTWCRTGPTALDCDDADPAIHPAGGGSPAPQDVCDGKDNDCDPSTSDGATCPTDTICDVTSCTSANCTPAQRCAMITCENRDICSADQFCDHTTMPPSCRPLVMSCLDPAYPCTSGQRCNPDNGQCVSAEPNGTPCNYDAECASNVCFLAESLRIATEDLGGADGICSHSCCDDSDCDAGQVCWDSGSGARACVPTSILALGANGAPAIDACVASSSCSAGICELSVDDAYSLDNRVSLSCGAPIASEESCTYDWDCWSIVDTTPFCDAGTCHLTYCDTATDCPTGICVGHRCAESCRTASDCSTGASTEAASPACLYAYVPTEGRMDFFPVCLYRDRTSTLENGAACTTHGECRDELCVDSRGRSDPEPGTEKHCAGACCSDTHCGDINGQCRPLFVGSGWEMHCLPRRTFAQSGGASSG